MPDRLSSASLDKRGHPAYRAAKQNMGMLQR